MYCNPEKYGLEVVGEIDWDQEPYAFNLTIVWRDLETKQLYYESDSGCSCPSPFEDITSKEQLAETTPEELRLYLHGRNTDGKCDMEIANLMGRIVN